MTDNNADVATMDKAHALEIYGAILRNHYDEFELMLSMGHEPFDRDMQGRWAVISIVEQLRVELLKSGNEMTDVPLQIFDLI